MLKRVNNACPSLPFTHIKAIVSVDTTVLVCFIGLLSPRFFKKASGILQSPPSVRPSVRHAISS